MYLCARGYASVRNICVPASTSTHIYTIFRTKTNFKTQKKPSRSPPLGPSEGSPPSAPDRPKRRKTPRRGAAAGRCRDHHINHMDIINFHYEEGSVVLKTRTTDLLSLNGIKNDSFLAFKTTMEELQLGGNPLLLSMAVAGPSLARALE